MTSAKQFWALIKFQSLINPYIVFSACLFFGTPFLIPLLVPRANHYHEGLSILLMNQNLFFVGIIGVMVIAPEVFQVGAAAAQWTSGTEFLLTRAVDRVIYFRARATFYYTLILFMPLLELLSNLPQPQLTISEYQPTVQRAILSQIPGSSPGAVDHRGIFNEITLPSGSLQVAGWHLLMFFGVAVGTYVFIALIYPLKFRRWIFWAAWLLVIFLPFFLLRFSLAKDASPTLDESAFLFFADHLALTTTGALVVGLALHLWAERRFSRLEY